MRSDEIRKKFIEYFKGKGHTPVSSSSLIPAEDPTLLFANAGMNQFKDIFTGQAEKKYSRAVSCQKCVRAGGKHNDLENVGYTARHHTFFEMLGNFSFGDYFKKEAIIYAWEFLTEVLKLPKDKLYVTVYKDDDEALELWKKETGISPEKIFKLGEKDNFWAMGETGPCGPCSEILIDQGEEFSCSDNCGIGKCECDRFLELWNLVFMQYNKDDKGNTSPLPAPSIDTGMGLERVTAVIQGQKSNFETDLIFPVIEEIARKTKIKYGQDKEIDSSMRAVADHARAVTFLIADGVIPSNEGRGYVLRRILRRAVRHNKLLGLNDPFLFELTQIVIEKMSGVYGELKERAAFIKKTVKQEEKNFYKTLSSGLKILNDFKNALGSKKTLPGKDAFTLYDTYGFPLDLTQDILKKDGIKVDEDGFNNEMERQREKSSSKKEEKKPRLKLKINQKQVFYEKDECQTSIAALFSEGNQTDTLDKEGAAVLKENPFYGEKGGQQSDIGILKGDGFEARVKKAFYINGDTVALELKNIQGVLKKGDACRAVVDNENRKALKRAHTATHILHAALKKIISSDINQAGSFVEPDRFRFDFNSPEKLNPSEIDKIEDFVFNAVLDNIEVDKKEMPLDEAKRKGAVAIFGEKYGDRVRVVNINGCSRELCGGLHASRTGDIGFFTVVKQSSVASGIRRIEALTGKKAFLNSREKINLISKTAGLLGGGEEEILTKVSKLKEENKNLKKSGGGADINYLTKEFKNINGVNVLIKNVEDINDNLIMSFFDSLKGDFICFITNDKKGGKALYIKTSDGVPLTSMDILNALKKELELSGGGRKDLARGKAGKFDEKIIYAKMKELL